MQRTPPSSPGPALVAFLLALGPLATGHARAADAPLSERVAAAAPWLTTPLLGHPLWRVGLAVVTLAAVVMLRGALMRLAMRALRRAAARTRTEVDDQLVAALDPPLGYFLAVLGLYVAARWLVLEPGADAALLRIVRIAAIVCGGWALLRCTSLLAALFHRLARRTASELDDRLAPLVARLARVLVLLGALILVIQELEFNVSGLIAGLGVGGLAFALAAKDMLANWFGAMMIYTDRPFDVGDWIKTPALEGTVEEIGLRSTRIRSFAQTVISVPNSLLANEVVENFSRMPIRRVSFDLRVTHATRPAAVRAAVAAVEALLRDHPEVDQTFWMVKFTDIGASALTIMIYYFTKTTDWAHHLQVRGDINLEILDRLAALGVEVALPAQAVHLREPPGR